MRSWSSATPIISMHWRRCPGTGSTPAPRTKRARHCRPSTNNPTRSRMLRSGCNPRSGSSSRWPRAATKAPSRRRSAPSAKPAQTATIISAKSSNGLRRLLGPAAAGLLLLALPFAASAQQGDAKRGEYLSKAAGCVGCHTEEKKDAQPYAGGRALQTPFGTFHGPNITPHAQAGIGRWGEQDFVRAMREGRRPDGAHYFPAFPYTSFTKISDSDLKDLWAYLRTLKPSAQKS